jgi:hypothetical protein
VKGGGIRGGKGVERGMNYSFYERGERILGRAWSIGQSGIYSAPGGCWRFWARRARISVDILGLGATSRQGGWFWVVS